MLEEFLKKHKIDFERIDVDENKIEVDEVPIIEKDGKVVMVGLPLNKEKLLEILK
jgi:arsenate reductase-like glutaredoxin family protein